MKRRTVSWRRATPMLAMLATLIAALAWASRPALAMPSVVTDQGPLKGVVVSNVNEYLGIPYAAPPVGKRRWLPPKSPEDFRGLFNATHFGNMCPQTDTFGAVIGSEDCLYLNVYTPTSGPPAHGFPVMVWIHGGGLTGGSGSLYDPTRLVKKGRVIVVTINYRLGALGFLAHPALDSEGHTNANYGLMDQQFALKWLRRNIGAFSGDRNRITIFGQSSGGLSVYSHLASPTAAGLFQRAIAQSGAGDNFQDYLQFIVPLADAEVTGTAFATTIGCSSQTASCLRATSASAIVLAQPSGLDPIIDGTLLTQSLGTAIATGAFNHVPVISGSTHDEWRVLIAQQYDFGSGPLTDGGYPDAVAALIGAPVSDPFVQLLVNVLYPLTNYPPPAGVMSAPLALGALGTDLLFSCPARNANLSLSQYVPTYAYEFNDENAPLYTGLLPASFPLGAYHGAEVQYLLTYLSIAAVFTADQRQLSDLMIGYWTNFAKTGDPNFAGAPTWTPYSAATEQVQSLVPPTPIAESSFDSDHLCSAFWSTF